MIYRIVNSIPYLCVGISKLISKLDVECDRVNKILFGTLNITVRTALEVNLYYNKFSCAEMLRIEFDYLSLHFIGEV